MDIFELFRQEELSALGELQIEPNDLVFTKKNLFSSKLLVCRLQLTDGLYSFDIPPKSPKKFIKQISTIEKKLLAANNAHIKKLMASAKKNAEFITRFNSELFLKHCFFKGKRLSVEELFDFYETHPFYKTINLSSDSDKQPFIALFAMTFYACSVQDLFTVDGIFSMQPERHADNAKKTASNGVFNLILRNDKAEIEQVLLTMGQTLINIHPIRVNLADMVMLSKNYTLFSGLSQIGRVFASVVTNNPGRPDAFKVADDVPAALRPALNAANELMKYAPLVTLCDKVSAMDDNEDYRKMPAYKKCEELF
jgi:hypothetical protein